MNSPDPDDGFDAYDGDDLAFFEEDYSDDLELPSQDESLEETNDLKSGSKHQPSALSISCYGAPEEDTSVEFIDQRFALEEEITLLSGEKVRLQLTNEQQQRHEVIRNLAQARHNRKIFSQRLGEGAEKLGLSRRQVRRIFQDWVDEGLASLQKAPRQDKGKPRRSEYWQDLSIKIYKNGNKGTHSLTRTQVADRVRTQAYEYAKLELRSDIFQLQENGLQGEDLDIELGKLIEQRDQACKQSKQAIQEEITQLKKKISELHKKKLDTRAVKERIKRLEQNKQETVAFEFWKEYGQPPSTRTVEIWLKPLEDKMNQAKTSRSPGWHGDKLVLRTRSNREIDVQYSNQVWQIDHTKADVLLVDEDGIEIGRPTLTTVIDTYSRCIVGYRLGLKPPSVHVVALALRHAMLSKEYGLEYELRCQWNAYGSPKYIYTDGGKDFKFLTYVGDQLGFEFELREQPSQGGVVERPFRTMSELLSEAPGYTGSNVQERPKDVEKVVCMTLREVDKLVAGYICDTYNQNPDPRTRANPFAPTQSRIARWEGGLRIPPPVLNPRDLDVCLMRTGERVVYDSGYIKFENLLYKGENLGQYAGDTVFLRFDPRDITMLLVYVRQNNREKFIARAYAINLESHRLSLEEVQHSAKKCRKSGKAINNIAIFEETLRRRKLLDSKKKKTKGERRHLEQMKMDSLPERYEEEQPKHIVNQHKEEQPKQQIEVLPTSVEGYVQESDDDESEDYGAEEYEPVEQVNYNKLRQEFGL